MEQVPHPDGTFELELRRQHLQQLRNVDIPDNHGHLPTAPWPLPGSDDPDPYCQLDCWSEQAKGQIAKAVSNRAYTLCASLTCMYLMLRLCPM